MSQFTVDGGRCVRDGLCVLACGRGVLFADENGRPHIDPDKAALCNGCAHCASVCPVHAVVPPGYVADDMEQFDPGLCISSTQARQFILSCRSVRRYRSTPVPDEEVVELLDVARRAPSASNAQNIRWLALSGQEHMSAFTALAVEWFDTVVRHDPARRGQFNVDWLVGRYRDGHDVILRGAPNAVLAITDKTAHWGATDCAIALTYFCLTAHARNIGSCWCGFGVRAIEGYQPLRDFLRLDPDSVVHGVVFFGFPSVKYHALPPRKPLRLDWLR